MAANKKIITIVGPTASGKTDLAFSLAKKINGEIICADSRTIYKEMDIGTAKPPQIYQQVVQHHCLNIISIDQRFSALEFKQLAQKTIKDINSRGKVPVIVGGSGLYVDALVYDYDFGSQSRSLGLEDKNLDQLQSLAERDRRLLSNDTWNNPRHLKSYLYRKNNPTSRKTIQTDYVIFGIKISDSELSARIRDRVERMFEAGFIDEVRKLVQKWPEDSPGLQCLGYPEVVRLLKGEYDQKSAQDKVFKQHIRLLKKQKTWFRRNEEIVWVNQLNQIEQYMKANN